MTIASATQTLPGVRFEGAAWPPTILAEDAALRESAQAAQAWLADNRAAIDALLLERGCVTFRGFGLKTPADFDRFTAAYPAHGGGYAGGTSPRGMVTGKVMESTVAPPDRAILIHQEMAYARDFPPRLAFFCEVAPAQGGETTLADMRRFTHEVDPTFFARIRENGLRYTRRFRNPDWSTGSADLDLLHRTWTDAYGTTDRDEAEVKCRATGGDCSWTPFGLEVHTYSQGWQVHPATGEEIWFNVISAFDLNEVSQGERFQGLHVQHYGDRYPWPQGVTLGDGTPFTREEIFSLYPLMDSLTVAPKWQAGDVQLLDNLLAAHGRATFSGERKICVAMLG